LHFPFIFPILFIQGNGIPKYNRKEKKLSPFKLKGFDKLEKQLKQMEKNAEEVSRIENISFSELFTTSFMRKYTSFSSMDELLSAGGFNIESPEDFENDPTDEFDKHIAATTKFNNWENMLDEATSQYIENNLGF